MHPAGSTILFTTTSGAGYGLLFILGVLGPLGLVPSGALFGFIAMGLALALIGCGLLASTAHLGRPERMLLAFREWRTSWLSREGVASIITFLPAGALGIGWVFLGGPRGWFALAGALASATAAATVFCTAMIYASLKPIRQWRQPLVPPVYLALALMTGAVLLLALTQALAAATPLFAVLVIFAIIVAWPLKNAYWRAIDAQKPSNDLASATGLGHLGKVRALESPHTEENFLMREMGFVIARKHAAKLRRIVHVGLFGVPLVCAGLTLAAPAIVGAMAAFVAVLSAGLGVGVERWLFFAEARHTAMIFYGRAP